MHETGRGVGPLLWKQRLHLTDSSYNLLDTGGRRSARNVRSVTVEPGQKSNCLTGKYELRERGAALLSTEPLNRIQEKCAPAVTEPREEW